MSIEQNTHGEVKTFKYKDLPAIQVWGVTDVFKELQEKHKFDLVFEFGTDYGGLTNALAEVMNVEIHTFDINATRFKNYHPSLINFYNLNIYENWENIKELLDTLYGAGSKVLFLCDGGDKKHEFNVVSQWLRPGDCIMVHDYFPDAHAFSEGTGRWNWWEFDEPVQDPTLKKTFGDFDNFVWYFREKV